MFQAPLLQIHHIAILAQEGAGKAAEEGREQAEGRMVGEKELPNSGSGFVQWGQRGEGEDLTFAYGDFFSANGGQAKGDFRHGRAAEELIGEGIR